MQINKNIIGKKQYILPYTSNYRYKLDVIENFWDPHPDVKKAIDKATIGKIHQYPYPDETYLELIDRISKYVNVNNNNILLTNGSDSALKLMLEGYVSSNTNTLILLPTYPHFISFIENISHGDIDYLTINLKDSNDLIISKTIGKLSSKQYNLCYICSPNLPLGYTLNNDQIIELLKLFKNTMFIIDEAYHEYPILDNSLTSTAMLVKNYQNLTVTRTFSKAFGLAGLRLGYLISSEENVNLIRILSNDKNVTSVAVHAGNAVLKNLDYYQKCAREVQNLKKMLYNELSDIVSPDDEITGFNVSGGNFFLLFAKNPSKVVDIFKQHDIYIRNKNDDILGAMRITMGTENMMRDVLLLCKWINIRSQLRKYGVIFDLDMTIRNGSKLSSPAFDGIELLNDLNSYICTSNGSHSIKEIHNWLISNNVQMDEDKIINPVRMIVNFSKNNPKIKKILIIGVKSTTDELKLMLPEKILTVEDIEFTKELGIDCVLCTGPPILSIDKIGGICKLLDKGALLAYTDSSISCDLSNCADTEMEGTTMIPDLGAYMKMYETCGYKPINIGKEQMLKYIEFDINIGYIIGDSIRSDGSLAKKLGRTFIHIEQTSSKSYVDFDNNKIVIPNIKTLVS